MSASKPVSPKYLLNVWKTLTADDKDKIRQTVGIDPDSCRTTAEKCGLLVGYYATVRRVREESQPLPEPPQIIIVNPLHPSLDEIVGDRNTLPPPSALANSRTILAPPRSYSPEGDIAGSISEAVEVEPTRHRRTVSSIVSPFPYWNNVKEYATLMVLTLTGAYIGFSAARYTDLAKQLRYMEHNPVIKAYELKHDLDVFQSLRELDFLSPERKKIDQGRELLDKVDDATDKATNLVEKASKLFQGLPWVGKGIKGLTDEQLGNIQDYKAKKSKYDQRLLVSAAGGGIGGLVLGAILSSRYRRKKGNE